MVECTGMTERIRPQQDEFLERAMLETGCMKHFAFCGIPLSGDNVNQEELCLVCYDLYRTGQDDRDILFLFWPVWSN